MTNQNLRNRQGGPACVSSSESVDGTILRSRQIKTRPLGRVFLLPLSLLVLNNFIGGTAQLDISAGTRIGIVGRYRAAA